MNYKKGTQTRSCMKSVMRYVSQMSKTLWDGQPLVSGIGCQPETAFDEFLSTKLLHQRTILFGKNAVFVDIQVCAERCFDLNVQTERPVCFLNIDFFNQHPQVRFRHSALSENVVNHADIPLELRLPIPQDSGDVLQFFDLLFRRGDFFFALLNHAVVALGICPVPYPLH